MNLHMLLQGIWRGGHAKPMRWVFKGSDCLQKDQNMVDGRRAEQTEQQTCPARSKGPNAGTLSGGIQAGSDTMETGVTQWSSLAQFPPPNLAPTSGKWFHPRFEPPYDPELTTATGRPFRMRHHAQKYRNKIKLKSLGLFCEQMARCGTLRFTHQ